MNYKIEGQNLRQAFKDLVYSYMKSNELCQSYNVGLSQAEIFRNCGMDWGEKENCTSSHQQYYIVAILRTLEEENKIQRDDGTKKWRLI